MSYFFWAYIVKIRQQSCPPTGIFNRPLFSYAAELSASWQQCSIAIVSLLQLFQPWLQQHQLQQTYKFKISRFNFQPLLQYLLQSTNIVLHEVS
jgi:hypothetical protein